MSNKNKCVELLFFCVSYTPFHRCRTYEKLDDVGGDRLKFKIDAADLSVSRNSSTIGICTTIGNLSAA
jgi:hypothetical protein